jgi:hypothetical protein
VGLRKLIGMLFVPVALTLVACSGQSSASRPSTAGNFTGTVTATTPSTSSTAMAAKARRAALARRQAKEGHRLYRECPNANAAPPPKDAAAPVVNVGWAARGKYYRHGQIRPRCLLWSGDGASDALGLRWKGWGGATATANGYGLTYHYIHGSRAIVPAQFRLGDRGYCQGVLEYRRVYERKAHSLTDDRWERWDNGYLLCAH